MNILWVFEENQSKEKAAQTNKIHNFCSTFATDVELGRLSDHSLALVSIYLYRFTHNWVVFEQRETRYKFQQKWWQAMYHGQFNWILYSVLTKNSHCHWKGKSAGGVTKRRQYIRSWNSFMDPLETQEINKNWEGKLSKLFMNEMRTDPCEVFSWR